MRKNRQTMVQKRNKKMRRTTIELTEEQYFFLKEKVLKLQKKDQEASIVSIIRDLIDQDRQGLGKSQPENAL